MDSALQQHYNNSLMGNLRRLAQKARTIVLWAKYRNQASETDRVRLRLYRKTVRKD